MSVITIKVTGVKELVTDYSAFRNDMKNMTVPLEASAKQYLNVIHTNFTDEGRTFGQAWPALSPTTIKLKQELKKKGKSIATKKPLVRTGLMRKSFDSEITSPVTASVINKTDYAKIHQEGASVQFNNRIVQIPKRILADVDTQRINMVANIFVKWLGGVVGKNKM